MMLSVLLAAMAATAPVPNMTTDWWSDYYDTPTQGLSRGELSVVVAEIVVNTYGGFAGCIGHVYTGNPQLGPYVCSRLQKRAEFKPARGPDGRKVIGVFRKLIIVANVNKPTQFKAPNFGIRVPGDASSSSDNPFEIQFYLDSNGQVSDCSLVDAVGINQERHKQVVDPATVERACAEVPSQLHPLPVLDKQGHPVASAQNALVVVDAPLTRENQ